MIGQSSPGGGGGGVGGGGGGGGGRKLMRTKGRAERRKGAVGRMETRRKIIKKKG